MRDDDLLILAHAATMLPEAERGLTKSHREVINRTGHFRRTKKGDLVWVEPHQVLAHIAEHGSEPDLPRNTAHSIWIGKQAMEECLKGHNVVDAMHRKGIGWIDFRQGTPGDGPPDFEHGDGIAHILAKRDYEHRLDKAAPDGTTTLRKLPEVLAKGKIGDRRGNKIELNLVEGRETWRAVLLCVPATKETPEERWLVSGFKRGTRR